MREIIEKYNNILSKNMGIIQFIEFFKNDAECLELYFALQYEEINCTKCGRSVIDNYVRVKRVSKNNVQKKSFRCKSCHTHIYPLSTTIFRKTPVSTKQIFMMLYFFCGKRSTSAVSMTNNTGSSYKTIHKLMMQVRDVMYDDLGRKLNGDVEIDEVFIGKGSKMYNWSSISTSKQPIVGMIERETKKAKVFLVDNRNVSTLRFIIKNNIEVGSNIYTDSWTGYNNLKKWYNHQSVNHSDREYVRGEAHTNTIENLWGSFKRNIRGAHIHISAKYVQLYMNELCWKHNNKELTTMQRFDKLLRSTYKGICTVSPHTPLINVSCFA